MATKTLEAVETPLSDSKTKLGSMIRQINERITDECLSVVESGKYFDVIEQDKIYKQKNDYGTFETFREFVEEVYVKTGIFTFTQVKDRIRVSRRYQAIVAKKPAETTAPLPGSISQIKPLLAYEPEQAAEIWWDGVPALIKSGRRVTGDNIDKYRRGAIDIPSEPVSQGNGDVATDDEPTDLDFSDTGTTETVTRTAAQLSTLDRIQALAVEGVIPANSREALENDTIRVPENHLSEWNEQEPERFKQIARLVFGAALTYDESKKLLSAHITSEGKIKIGETLRLVDFVYLAIAKGGRGSVSFRGYTVIAEPDAE
jgi:hypothetical protein